MELITHRTQADVDRVKELAAKGWAGMTAAERDEWMGVEALDITVQGHTILQSGTPTPDNVLKIGSIETVTGEFGGVPYEIVLAEPLYAGDTLQTNVDGLMVEKHRTRRLVLDGTEAWAMASDDPTTRFMLEGAALGCSGLSLSQHCTHYSASSYAVRNLCCYVATTGAVYIHDQTHADVDSFKAYLAEQYAAGTPVTIVYGLAMTVTHTQERILMNVENAVLLGAYNYRDLNRVESAVAELAASMGITVKVKTDWTAHDAPRMADMERYLGNVKALKARNDAISPTPLPESMAGLTWEAANNIEQFLLDVEAFLTTYYRAGEIYCGEVT